MSRELAPECDRCGRRSHHLTDAPAHAVRWRLRDGTTRALRVCRDCLSFVRRLSKGDPHDQQSS